MRLSLNRILPAIFVLAAAISVHAETTGRITGKVVNKKGEALANAVVTLKRVDINWTKVLQLNAKATFMQVGLEPKEFTLLVSCPGYADFSDKVKIPLGDVLVRNVEMLTPAEALAESRTTTTTVVVDTGLKAESEATEATNQAIAFYKEQKFAEALPLLELAQLKFRESIAKTTDLEAKATLEGNLGTTERVLGIVLANNFTADPAKVELAAKALPLLEKAIGKKPDDVFALQAIVDLAKAKKDAALESKHKPALDKLTGPKPEMAYNEAVTAFNANNMKVAKEHLLKAIAIDPKFPESYYLLGMVEYGEGNLKASKTALLKYLELDPNGKKAADVKEALNDPSIKKIK